MLWQPTRGLLQPNQHWRRPSGGGGFDPLSLSPRLWLKFNDGSGTTPQDSSGNGNHGSFINTPSYVAGPPAALDFTAADRDAVQVTGLLGEPEFVTAMAWVNFDASDSSASEVLSVGDNIVIRLSSTTLSAIYHGAGGYKALDHSVALEGDGWHHYAYVTGPDRQELYLDGVSVETSAWPDAIDYLAGNTLLGRHPSATDYDFDGRMRNMLVFPSGLTTEQIQAVMAVT